MHENKPQEDASDNDIITEKGPFRLAEALAFLGRHGHKRHIFVSATVYLPVAKGRGIDATTHVRVTLPTAANYVRDLLTSRDYKGAQIRVYISKDAMWIGSAT